MAKEVATVTIRVLDCCGKKLEHRSTDRLENLLDARGCLCILLDRAVHVVKIEGGAGEAGEGIPHSIENN